MSVCLHSFSRMVGAIFLWYSYIWTLTFNGGRGSRATCCLKKLILSLSKCILDTSLVWLVMDLIMCIYVSIEYIGKQLWYGAIKQLKGLKVLLNTETDWSISCISSCCCVCERNKTGNASLHRLSSTLPVHNSVELWVREIKSFKL